MPEPMEVQGPTDPARRGLLGHGGRGEKPIRHRRVERVQNVWALECDDEDAGLAFGTDDRIAHDHFS